MTNLSGNYVYTRDYWSDLLFNIINHMNSSHKNASIDITYKLWVNAHHSQYVPIR